MTAAFALRPAVIRGLCATLLCALGLGAGAATNAATAAQPAAATADPRIVAMKSNARGPFARIRWFCKDGTLLPPEPDACKPHGGGAQHGEWSSETLALRAAGYHIANVYADLDVDALLAHADAADRLAQMAVERFLISADDGWILRKARSYRGAFQEEGERRGGERLLLALAGRQDWSTTRYLQLRSLAAALPHAGTDTASARAVRQKSSALAQQDAAFMPLRNKIHAAPGLQDAEAVRTYARAVTDPARATGFAELAAAIDQLYAVSSSAVLSDIAVRLGDAEASLVEALERHRAALPAAAHVRLASSAALLRELRREFMRATAGTLRLHILDASLAVEADHFAAAAEIAAAPAAGSRRARLDLLAASLDALYGVGLLSMRQWQAQIDTLARLTAPHPDLKAYRAEIEYLGLTPHWGNHNLEFLFGGGVAKLAEIEPLARLFPQDHLRGSPMFFFADVIDGLLRDANRLAGIRHRLFDEDIGAGLRALNPGLVRGVLRDGRTMAAREFRADGIYLLPETTADLPPVAGILTAGEGNPLSHVQLLARNLGIPNVGVEAVLLDRLAARAGASVVLAVSAGGAVHLLPDSPAFDAVFAAGAGERHRIEPELDKLDLAARELLDLAQLRAADSGRTVGPKAAKLGELKAHYPQAVSDGIAIPFGAFRALLERPSPQAGVAMFDYIVAAYRALERLPAGSAEREQATERLRQELEDWVGASALSPELGDELRRRLEQRLGADGSYGVFVRSDTNVEDLPGFTGAGLNLTVPNVVGFDNIAAAIPRVWASPFTARAFSWRQALMSQPEHVYPAVLLLESVDADKSGVLVTQDIDSGDRAWISVAVNEGVGGAVDGQSAESLRIHLASGRVRLMAQASAPYRRQLNPAGGVSQLPVSGAEQVLSPAEIDRLVDFARGLPATFPPIVDADGNAAPADVEFGFRKGELRLFQIRPFLDNPAARRNQYLLAMDPPAATLEGIEVDLTAPLE